MKDALSLLFVLFILLYPLSLVLDVMVGRVGP